jgi:hypothetical protein
VVYTKHQRRHEQEFARHRVKKRLEALSKGNNNRIYLGKCGLSGEPIRELTNNVTDYGVCKAVENLPELRDKLSGIIDRYHKVQQDILEFFVDRGQLLKLIEPANLPNGERIPGLKLDHPKQLTLMQALVHFSRIAAQDSFSTAEAHADTAEALAHHGRLLVGITSIRPFQAPSQRARRTSEKISTLSLNRTCFRSPSG